MIVTVTPNPSLDLTYTLSGQSGADVDVHRATKSTLEASGKGVNISRALSAFGSPTCAIFPAGGATGRYLAELLADDDVSHRVSPQRGDTRINTTALRPDGVTVKLNGPGGELSSQEQQALLRQTELAVEDARTSARSQVWVAVCGSLPPSTPPAFVARVVDLAHAYGAKCAVDVSGDALAAALEARPDLLAPNRLELAEVSAAAGTASSLDELAAAARGVSLSTGGAVLVSLGRDGALFTDGEQILHGWGPPLQPVNTAGAGDALLAGWLSSDTDASSRLERAVTWGRSACLCPTTVDLVPGTRDPGPVTVRELPLAGTT